MKKIAYLFSTATLVAITLLSSCKKDKEPTPDVDPQAPVATATMTTSNKGLVAPTLTVSTSTGTAKIRLDVTSTVDLDKIYITKSEDNGTANPLSFSTITSADSKTFTGGSVDYSYSIPSSTKSFILDIPVSVRTSSSAVTDVYSIWITNGNGAFTKPTKNTVLGVATVTLKYGSASAYTYQTFNATLASQLNSAVGSLLVTSGQGTVFSTSDYQDAPESIDLSLSSLNAGGTALGTNSNWLFSPDLRDDLGFVSEPSSANTTVIANYTGTATFDNITGAELNALSAPSSSKVEISAGSVYLFVTEAGKKGLIKVSSSYAYSISTSATVAVTIKVLN